MYLLCPLVLSCCVSFIWARPVRMNGHSNAASKSMIDVATLSTNLGDFYESTTYQCIESFNQKLLSEKEYNVRFLEQQVDFLRSNLIASIQPLVDSNLPWVISPPPKKKDNDDDDDDDDDDDEDEEEAPLSIIPLTKAIQALNKRMSTQLGQIIHANQLARTMVYQAQQQISLSRPHQDMESWLARHLAILEKTLEREFNERIDEAVQFIMEDFLT